MTTATFSASHVSSPAAAPRADALLARLWLEVTAFFQEMRAAQALAAKNQPFGL